MTTAYTSLLGLALPVTGELDGTWGDVVNNSITTLLDSAIAGTTTISTDADVTLTTTTGSANQSREAILLWTANGTTTRNITAPAQSKIYTVINASAGTQSIVLRGAGPTTGVTILKGEAALCAWNGSDFIKISNTAGSGTFTNLTVTGNTTLGDAAADNITVNGTITSNLIFTDNTYDIGASGATRPRNLYLAGTATIGGNTTLSGGTANGVAYLNGSKVLTTGSALTFDGTALVQSSTTPIFRLTPSITNALQGIEFGTAGNLDAYIKSQPNTAEFRINSGRSVGWGGFTSFYIDTAEAMRLTSTGLGIGTSSPNAPLQVVGADLSNGVFKIGQSSNTTGKQLLMGVTTTGNGYAWMQSIYQGSAYTDLVLQKDGGNLGLGVTPSAWGSNFKALDFGGNVGIAGYANSMYQLTNAYAENAAYKYKASTFASMYLQTSGQHIFYTAPSGTAGNAISFTQAMTLDASGNLVIGQTLAGARVTAKGDNSLQFFNAANTNQTDIGFPDAQTFNIRTYHASGSSISFGTNAQYGSTTERMRLDSSGNLLVGTTSAGNYKSRTIGAVRALQIQNIESDNTDKYGLIAAGQNASGSNPNGFTLVGGSAQSGANSTFIGGGFSETNAATAVVFYTAANATTASGTERARIDSSGNLLINTTSSSLTNSNSHIIVPNGSIYTQHVSGTGSGATYYGFVYNAGVIGSITQNGTTGVLYNLTSDYRLKNDPQPLTGAKEFVMALQPKKWQWWDGSGEGVGFIAHEFMEVAKYSGNGEKDAVDEDGNPVYQSIQPSSSEVMANLVALIQEQQAIIQQLQADVAALKGN